MPLTANTYLNVWSSFNAGASPVPEAAWVVHHLNTKFKRSELSLLRQFIGALSLRGTVESIWAASQSALCSDLFISEEHSCHCNYSSLGMLREQLGLHGGYRTYSDKWWTDWQMSKHVSAARLHTVTEPAMCEVNTNPQQRTLVILSQYIAHKVGEDPGSKCTETHPL